MVLIFVFERYILCFLAFLLIWCIYFGNLFYISLYSIEISAFKLFGFLQEGCLLYVTKDKMWNFLKSKSRFTRKRENFIWVFVMNQDKNIRIAILDDLFSFSEESSLLDIKSFVFGTQLFICLLAHIFFFGLDRCLLIVHLMQP